MNTSQTNELRWLEEIGEDEHQRFGGKAVQLAKLQRGGLPVPKAFVIPTSEFTKHLRSSDKLSRLFDRFCSTACRSELSIFAKDICQRLKEARVAPELLRSISNFLTSMDAQLYAVRSSAPEEDGLCFSWAGQFESFLGKPQSSIEESVLAIWSSIFSERAISYREHSLKNLSGVSIAIIIQEMIDPDFSGVIFSTNPVGGQESVIEYVQGLAEPLVSGEIIPERIFVHRETFSTVRSERGNQREALRLSPQEGTCRSSIVKRNFFPEDIRRLTEMALSLEASWKTPVDIEWAMKDSSTFLLQARPITAISGEELQKKIAPFLSFQDGLEFSWAECHSVITAECWIENYLTHRSIPGNNCENAALFSESGYVSSYVLREEKQRCYRDGATLIAEEEFQSYLRHSNKVQQAWKQLHSEWSTETDRSRTSILSYYERFQENFNETYALYKISQPECGDALAEALSKRIEALGFPPEKSHEIFQLATLAPRLDIIQEEELDSLRLCDLEEISPELSQRWAVDHAWQFFNTYNREVAEEFQRVRFEDLQRLPLTTRQQRIARLLHTPLENAQRQLCLGEFQDPELIRLGRNIAELGLDRFRLKNCWAGAEFRFLDLLEATAEFADLSLEEFLSSYRCEDVRRLLRNETKLPQETRVRRANDFAVILFNREIYWFEGEEAKLLKQLLIPREQRQETFEIEGQTANLGLVHGRVRKIRVEGLERLLQDLDSFQEGDILVTTMTQPTMVALARKAAAVVTDEGGVTCHAAIIARELGLPCIVGTRRATEILQDGEFIEVDAYRGIIRRRGENVT